MDAMLGREGEQVLVNGQVRPVVTVPSGGTHRWRVVNTCVSRFLRLRLDGQPFGLLGYDGQALHDPVERDELLLAPGNRVDVLVRAPQGGSSSLRALPYDRGGMGGMGGMGGSGAMTGGSDGEEVELATVVAGPVLDGSSGWVGRATPVEDLRGTAVDTGRTIAMSGGGAGMAMTEFGFDGRTFDPGRVDQRLRLGTVEEWTVTNPTTMDHPFHLHVWPMQVVAAADLDESAGPQWRDVVVVPAGGRVTVRVPVRRFGGRTVYHCHVLDHEDLGMMGVVEAT